MEGAYVLGSDGLDRWGEEANQEMRMRERKEGGLGAYPTIATASPKTTEYRPFSPALSLHQPGKRTESREHKHHLRTNQQLTLSTSKVGDAPRTRAPSGSCSLLHHHLS